jgi:hypothetical protein
MRSGNKKSDGKRPAATGDLPLFCDYSCPHADFAPKEAVGDCRKELAVYCSLLKQFNTKNKRCLVPAKK